MKLSTLKRLLFVSGIAISAPLICLPSAILIEVNGNIIMPICEIGNCSSPGSLSPGGSISSTPYTFDYTFANGDMYVVNGIYSASYGVGPHLTFSATDSYVGNSSNTASASDTMSVDLLEYFTSPPDGTYGATATLTQASDVAPGSQVTSQLLVDGLSTGLMGPYTGTGSMAYTSSGTSFMSLPQNTLFDFNYTFYTAAGSSPVVPEPANAGLLFAGILIVGAAIVGRKLRADVLQ